MPNLVNRTKTAIRESPALKKMIRRIPPDAAMMNAAMKLTLGPIMSIK